MAVYEYELVGERFIGPHTRAQVHRVFAADRREVTVCECFDHDNLVRVVKALNQTYWNDGRGMSVAQDEGMGDVVA